MQRPRSGTAARASQVTGAWLARLLHAPLTYRRRTQVAITAPASRVWSVLIDFDAYPVWNPLIRGASGKLDPGQRLTLVVVRPSGATAVERPTVAASCASAS